MPAQILDFQINPKSALSALKLINDGLRDSEGNFVKSGEKLQGAFENVTKSLIQLTDRQHAANERLVKSLEAQAVAANKTGEQKLIAQRDLIIKRLGDEESQVKRVKEAYDKLIEAQKGGGGNLDFKSLGQDITNFIQNPMQGAGGAVTGFMEKLGPMGIAVGATVGVITAFGVAGYEAAKSLAQWERQLQAIELRTGLTAKQVGEFTYAAQAVGSDITIVERSMRGLTVAIEDQGSKGDAARDWLRKWGVSLSDVRNGTADTADTLQKVGLGFASLPAGIQRDTAAIDIFRRQGIELIPMLVELAEHLKQAQAAGFGFQEPDAAAKKLTEDVAAFDLQWDTMVRKMKSGIVVPIQFLYEHPGNFQGASGANLGGGRAGADGLSPEQFNFNIPQPSADWIRNAENQKRADARQKAINGISGDQSQYGQTLPGLEQLKSAAETRERNTQSVYFDMKDSTTASAEQIKKAGDAWKAATNDVDKYTNAIQRLKDQLEMAKQFPGLIAEFDKKIKDSNDSIVETMSKGGIKGLEHNNTDIDETVKRNNKSQLSDFKDMEDAAKERRAATLKFEEELIKMQSGPGGELETATRIYELKMASAKTETEAYVLGLDYQTQVLQIQMDADKKHAEAMAEAAKRQQEALEHLEEQKHEEISKTAGSLFGSLMTKKPGPDFLKELTSITTKDTSKMFGDSVADIFVPGGNKTHNEMMKAGLDVNTTATQTNTAATYALAETLAAGLGTSLAVPASVSAGGGAPSVSVPSVSVPSSAMGVPSWLSGGHGFSLPGGFGAPSSGGSALPVHIESVSSSAMDSPSSSANPSMSYTTRKLLGMSTDDAGWSNNVFNPSASPSMLENSNIFNPSFSSPTASPIASDYVPNFGSESDVTYGAPGGFGALTSMGRTGRGFSFPAIFGGGSGSPSVFGGGSPGGTSGFAGPVSGGFSNQGGFVHSSLGSLLSTAKGSFNTSTLFGQNPMGLGTKESNSTPDNGGSGDETDFSGDSSTNTGGFSATTGVGGIAGGLMGSFGTKLAVSGLFGQDRGTGAGIGEAAGGGAMIGMEYGGPIGAAIGAAAGALAGTGEMLAGDISPRTKAKRQVKQKYNIVIQNQTADQIVSIAQSKYGGNVSLAVASPEVRQMLGVYAAGTGQGLSGALMASTPHAAGLTQQGGALTQTAEYMYGTAYSFKSGIPVANGLTSQSYQSPSGYNGSSPVNISGLSISVSGGGMADFMTNNVVNSDYVAASMAQANQNSNGRVQSSAQYQAPGLLA